jgi:PAS domain-containing protein
MIVSEADLEPSPMALKGIKTSGLVHTAQSDIKQLQRILREGYVSGFTIFKELLQNADDAGARNMLIAPHIGLAEAQNPLLRAPGLIIANDGPVKAEHMVGITRASGGSKAGDKAAVGRFGLGQKSVYHLCDAFFALGWIEDRGGQPEILLMNPWNGVAEATAASSDWNWSTETDARLLLDCASTLKLDRGLVLFVPLRTKDLIPGPKLCLTQSDWSADTAIRNITEGAERSATLCCLRNIETVRIRRSDGSEEKIFFKETSKRLAGPGSANGSRDICGTIRDRSEELEFRGLQNWAEGGEAKALLKEEGWDQDFTIDHQLIDPKADPHGAVIFCRRNATGCDARLIIRNTVYLPLGEPVEVLPLEAGRQDIEMLVHGYFFVSSDRKALRDDGHIEARWNEVLRREATLPLLLDALRELMADIGRDPERYALIRALGRSDWWAEHRADACRGRMLARTWSGDGSEAKWEVTHSGKVRPVPLGDAKLSRLKEAIPDLTQWCASRDVVLSFGFVLGEDAPRWPDEELAELVHHVGPTAFTKGPVAQTLATIIDGQAGPITREALAEQFRLVAADSAKSFGPADGMKSLIRHLPPDKILILPRTVENRQVIAALASEALPVKENWLVDPSLDHRRIGATEAVALLSELEPLLTQSGLAGAQAGTMVSHILKNGPSLEELARHPQGKSLRVIPAKHMQIDEVERLSFERIAELQRQGLLFDAGSIKHLDLLAQAVSAPAIFRLGLKDDGIFGSASANRKESLARVLRIARQFDDPVKCGELAELLKDDGPSEDLRRLVARDPELDDAVELVELHGFGDALDDLADQLCRDRGARLIPHATAAELHKVKSKIDLRPLDVQLLAKWIDEARSGGTLPPIDDATAQALLKSAIDDEALKPLPLHRSAGVPGLLNAHQVFLGDPAKVPPSLSTHARFVDLWLDQKAAARQRSLVPEWGPEATIRTALDAEQPERFTVEICEALKALKSVSDALLECLRVTAWIEACGAVWRPDQIIDLGFHGEKAWTALVPRSGSLLSLSKTPDCLRDDQVQEALAGVLPDRKTSFEAAILCLGEEGVPGLCVDVGSQMDDLRRIAKKKAELTCDAWPLMISALGEDLADDDLIALAELLDEPDTEATVAQMNSLAQIASDRRYSEVCRRLHRHAFETNLELLQDDMGDLPAALLLLNESNRFEQADRIARDAAGLAPEAVIGSGYAVFFRSDDIGQNRRTEAAPVIDRLPLASAIERAFEPLVKHDIGNGLLFALAMLGRGDDIQALAKRWQGQTSFARICSDLDNLADEQRDLQNANIDRLAELKLLAHFPERGMVRVRSLAGNIFEAPLSERGDALLIECRNGGSERDAGGTLWHRWDLVLGEVAPANADEAVSVLRQFVLRLAPALMLSFPQQKQALADLFDGYFASNQCSLDTAIEELREVLHDRLGGIKSGNVIKQALSDYHRDKHRDKEGARDRLWQTSQSEEGAKELLEAMRSKIAEMGYQPDRVLFELYQNAVDAQAQWSGQGKVRVEAQRDADGTINRLRLIHWGRPINQPGPDPRKAEQEGHERDLSNMLAISHSAKEGDTVTGRFGLGFKTVHMLSDSVGIASAAVILRIAGGMIPAAWEDGESEAGPYNERGRKATLIDIPIAPDRRDEAELAWTVDFR